MVPNSNNECIPKGASFNSHKTGMPIQLLSVIYDKSLSFMKNVILIVFFLVTSGNHAPTANFQTFMQQGALCVFCLYRPQQYDIFGGHKWCMYN